MAEKKTATKKNTAGPSKSAEKRQEALGYVCGVRGLAVPAAEPCGCAQFCDVECYGMPAIRKAQPKAKASLVRIVGDS